MARKRGAKEPVASAPAPEPEPEPVEGAPEGAGAVAPEAPVKKKREGVKMTDKQKADLNKHMEKVSKDMSVSERKSHRMKMMSQMRKGKSINQAHKEIKSSA